MKPKNSCLLKNWMSSNWYFWMPFSTNQNFNMIISNKNQIPHPIWISEASSVLSSSLCIPINYGWHLYHPVSSLCILPCVGYDLHSIFLLSCIQNLLISSEFSIVILGLNVSKFMAHPNNLVMVVKWWHVFLKVSYLDLSIIMNMWIKYEPKLSKNCTSSPLTHSC